MRILICDDHAMIREGLKALIKGIAGMQVVGEADNGRDVLRLCADLKPDLVIMDVGMPELNGVEATRRLTAEFPGTKVIALSMHASRRMVREMLRAGAIGYVLKNSAFDELATALDCAAKRRSYISPAVTEAVLENISEHEREASPGSVLTTREREVLQLLAEGYGPKEIAARLFMSENTAQTHRRNIMEKLNIHSIAKLTKFAIREGITSPED